MAVFSFIVCWLRGIAVRAPPDIHILAMRNAEYLGATRLRVSEEGVRRGTLVVNVCSACQGSMGYLSCSLLGFCCGSFKSRSRLSAF